MTLSIDLRPEAEQELQDAYNWYESKQRGLGDAFVDCVDDRLHEICHYPEAYPVVHRQVRRCVLDRFPYSILYIREGSGIVVIAIFHGRRSPDDWKERG